MKAETWPLMYQPAVHVFSIATFKLSSLQKTLIKMLSFIMFIGTDSWPAKYSCHFRVTAVLMVRLVMLS